ncbi:hypothetical protein AN958_11377 [Leucoagaricus sp. SymC.cos]|nr:hypothetical protein AN958_11377 [Leucoagaricus sp. SymC.cos]
MSNNTRLRVLDIISFGHNYGPLQTAPTLSYDVRTIPNPPRELRQQQKALNDATALRRWLLENPVFLSKINYAKKEIRRLIDAGVDESVSGHHLTVGVNCQLGRHRSVTFVNELARSLREELGEGSPWEIRVKHRDLGRRLSKRSTT